MQFFSRTIFFGLILFSTQNLNPTLKRTAVKISQVLFQPSTRTPDLSQTPLPKPRQPFPSGLTLPENYFFRPTSCLLASAGAGFITNSPDFNKKFGCQTGTFGDRIRLELENLYQVAQTAQESDCPSNLKFKIMSYSLGAWLPSDFFKKLIELGRMGVVIQLIIEDPSKIYSKNNGFLKNYWKNPEGRVDSLKNALLYLQKNGIEIRVHVSKDHVTHAKVMVCQSAIFGTPNVGLTAFEKNHEILKQFYDPEEIEFLEKYFDAHWENDPSVTNNCSFLPLDEFLSQSNS